MRHFIFKIQISLWKTSVSGFEYLLDIEVLYSLSIWQKQQEAFDVRW